MSPSTVLKGRLRAKRPAPPTKRTPECDAAGEARPRRSSIAGSQPLVDPAEGALHVIVAGVPLVPLQGIVDVLDLGVGLQCAADVVGHGEGGVTIARTVADAPVPGDAVGVADRKQARSKYGAKRPK